MFVVTDIQAGIVVLLTVVMLLISVPIVFLIQTDKSSKFDRKTLKNLGIFGTSIAVIGSLILLLVYLLVLTEQDQEN